MKPTGQARHDGDHYWQLEYESFTLDQLQQRARVAGRQTASRKADMIKTVRQMERQLPNYRRCSLPELRKFVVDRRLLPHAGDCSEKSLSQILEAADEQVEFTRCLDLPPELRCQVYTWYMSAFPGRLDQPSQPPITKVSRLLWHEATPIFYRTCQFQLDLVGIGRGNKGLRFNVPTHHFLVSLEPANLAELRRFQMWFPWKPDFPNMCKYKFDVELQPGEKGLIPTDRDNGFDQGDENASAESVCKEDRDWVQGVFLEEEG